MEFLVVSEQDKVIIRQKLDTSAEDVHRKIQEIQNWLQDCGLYPEEAQKEDFLERFLLRHKFKVAETKKAIETYFKCFKDHPAMFRNLQNEKPSDSILINVPVPGLTKDKERVVIFKLSEKGAILGNYDVDKCIQTAVMGGLTATLDYVYGARVVLDCEHASIWHLWKTKPTSLYRFLQIQKALFKVKITGIEILNAPGIINGILYLAKLVLPPKLLKRVKVHEDLESLHRNISVDNLPKDYGGNLQTIEQLREIMDQIALELGPFYEKLEYFTTL